MLNIFSNGKYFCFFFGKLVSIYFDVVAVVSTFTLYRLGTRESVGHHSHVGWYIYIVLSRTEEAMREDNEGDTWVLNVIVGSEASERAQLRRVDPSRQEIGLFRRNRWRGQFHTQFPSRDIQVLKSAVGYYFCQCVKNPLIIDRRKICLYIYIYTRNIDISQIV